MSKIDDCYERALYEASFSPNAYQDAGIHGIIEVQRTDIPGEFITMKVRIRQSDLHETHGSRCGKTLEVIDVDHNFEGVRSRVADALLYVVPHLFIRQNPTLRIYSSMPCVTYSTDVLPKLSEPMAKAIPRDAADNGLITPAMFTAMWDFLMASLVTVSLK
jgi:hypothetical protein